MPFPPSAALRDEESIDDGLPSTLSGYEDSIVLDGKRFLIASRKVDDNPRNESHGQAR